MSGLIKARTAPVGERVRPLAQEAPVHAPTLSPIDAEVLALRELVERQAQEIAALRAEAERLSTSVGVARREGEALGRAAALREAEGHATEALRRLDAGIATAVDEVSSRMAAMDRLAAQLARAALERVFTDTGRMGAMVQGAISQQLATLESSLVVRVEVSVSDFPSSAALETLASSLGSALTIVALDELEAGACHFRLTLGGLEVGPAQQWRRLANLLDEMSEPAT